MGAGATTPATLVNYAKKLTRLETANTSTLALEMVLLNIGTLYHRHLITGIQFSYIKGGMYIYETLMNRVSPYVYFRVRVKKCNLK